MQQIPGVLWTTLKLLFASRESFTPPNKAVSYDFWIILHSLAAQNRLIPA